jgi:hypothetical protein
MKSGMFGILLLLITVFGCIVAADGGEPQTETWGIPSERCVGNRRSLPKREEFQVNGYRFCRDPDCY